jgi:hypothetical protein
MSMWAFTEDKWYLVRFYDSSCDSEGNHFD